MARGRVGMGRRGWQDGRLGRRPAPPVRTSELGRSETNKREEKKGTSGNTVATFFILIPDEEQHH